MVDVLADLDLFDHLAGLEFYIVTASVAAVPLSDGPKPCEELSVDAPAISSPREVKDRSMSRAPDRVTNLPPIDS
jgi:hypothetical protein